MLLIYGKAIVLATLYCLDLPSVLWIKTFLKLLCFVGLAWKAIFCFESCWSWLTRGHQLGSFKLIVFYLQELVWILQLSNFHLGSFQDSRTLQGWLTGPLANNIWNERCQSCNANLRRSAGTRSHSRVEWMEGRVTAGPSISRGKETLTNTLQRSRTHWNSIVVIEVILAEAEQRKSIFFRSVRTGSTETSKPQAWKEVTNGVSQCLQWSIQEAKRKLFDRKLDTKKTKQKHKHTSYISKTLLCRSSLWPEKPLIN